MGGDGEAVKPGDIVVVADFSADTIRSLIAHLEVSTAFEHFVFREAELGALWSLTGFALGKREDVTRLRDAVLQAYDLLGRKLPLEAIRPLRSFIQTLSSDRERHPRSPHRAP